MPVERNAEAEREQGYQCGPDDAETFIGPARVAEEGCVASGIDCLTLSERRIAERAAAGASNREIAEALIVSVKAVEMHLGHAYRKLRIAYVGLGGGMVVTAIGGGAAERRATAPCS